MVEVLSMAKAPFKGVAKSTWWWAACHVMKFSPRRGAGEVAKGHLVEGCVFKHVLQHVGSLPPGGWERGAMSARGWKKRMYVRV